MNCPHCHSSSTTEQEGRTVHGFRRFRCRDCERRYNERTGTVLNRVQVPTDIVFLFWRLRYKLSLRDLAEMFLILESAPDGKRGTWVGIVWFFGHLPNALVAIMLAVLQFTVGAEAYSDGIWRVPFLMGGLIGIVGYW